MQNEKLLQEHFIRAHPAQKGNVKSERVSVCDNVCSGMFPLLNNKVTVVVKLGFLYMQQSEHMPIQLIYFSMVLRNGSKLCAPSEHHLYCLRIHHLHVNVHACV